MNILKKGCRKILRLKASFQTDPSLRKRSCCDPEGSRVSKEQASSRLRSRDLLKLHKKELKAIERKCRVHWNNLKLSQEDHCVSGLLICHLPTHQEEW